jgi:hypothetical protein
MDAKCRTVEETENVHRILTDKCEVQSLLSVLRYRREDNIEMDVSEDRH